MCRPDSTRRGGFTLIELMIVVAIIAILAAIAIPSLFRSRVAANESVAIGTLRNFVSAESMWYQSDIDGNAMPDYWTSDVYGMYACADGAGRAVKVVDVAVAKSDKWKRGWAGFAAPRPYYTGGVLPATVSKSGYVVHSLFLDENWQTYAADGPDVDGKPCENTARFGFAAIPERYGSTGVNSFQVNEGGVIYSRDTGFGNEIFPPQASWSGGQDPTTAVPAWRVIQ